MTARLNARRNKCNALLLVAACDSQILLSLQPDEMWEHVGSMYRELQWCSVVISALPKDELNSITTIRTLR